MAVMARDNWTDQRLDDLNTRVESIDRRMEAGFTEMREELRALRGETKGESQANRGEMRAEARAIRGEMKTEFQAIRGEMKTEFQAVRSEMAAMGAMLNQTIYRLFGGMLVAWIVGIVAILARG